MATTAEINAHDKLIQQLATEYRRGLRPLLNIVFDQIAQLEQPSRFQIQQLFQQLILFTQQKIQQLDQVVESNQNMNSEFIQAIDLETVRRLKQEAEAQAIAALEQERNSIIGALVFGTIVGSAIAVQPLRARIPAILSRLEIAFNTAARSFDGALTLSETAPSQRFRYVGGIVAESRDFCVRHNGKEFTRQEIQKIWSTQNWQGKRPGNPFVVRGGYNCRHQFIPVEGDE